MALKNSIFREHFGFKAFEELQFFYYIFNMKYKEAIFLENK